MIFNPIVDDNLRLEKIKEILPLLKGNLEVLNKEYFNKQTLLQYSLKIENIEILKFLLENNVTSYYTSITNLNDV